MRNKMNMTRFAVLIAAVLALAVLASFGRGLLFGRDTPAVKLPELSAGPAASADPYASPGPDEGGALRVEVTPETVQAVVSTLARPESYRASVETVTYWSGGSGAQSLTLWTDGACAAVRTETDGSARRSLTDGETLWLWYEGERALYAGPLGETAADDLARVPTYEDVLAAAPEDILAAGYETKNGKSCVMAELARGAGRTARYWVSVESGLLAAAELYDGETLTCAVTISGVVTPAADGGVFLLPDGTDVRK